MKPGPLTSALATAGAAVSRPGHRRGDVPRARPSRLRQRHGDVGLIVGKARRPDQRIGSRVLGAELVRQCLLHERAECCFRICHLTSLPARPLVISAAAAVSPVDAPGLHAEPGIAAVARSRSGPAQEVAARLGPSRSLIRSVMCRSVSSAASLHAARRRGRSRRRARSRPWPPGPAARRRRTSRSRTARTSSRSAAALEQGADPRRPRAADHLAKLAPPRSWQCPPAS